MKLGVFQAASGGLDLAARLERLRQVISHKQLDMVVCPELFLSGYDIGDEILRSAQPVDGECMKRVGELAAQTGTAIVCGYPERFGNLIYNSAACVGPDGHLLANHRKTANSPGSFEEDYFAIGETATIFTYSNVSIGILICFESELTEGARFLAAAGAELIVVPTALVSGWEIVANKLVPTRAFENGVWLAYVNHAGKENSSEYLGGSRIVAPDGREHAIAGDGEELIMAEIEMDRIRLARQRLPYLEYRERFAQSMTIGTGV